MCIDELGNEEPARDRPDHGYADSHDSQLAGTQPNDERHPGDQAMSPAPMNAQPTSGPSSPPMRKPDWKRPATG